MKYSRPASVMRSLVGGLARFAYTECHFQVADAEEEWNVSDEFDLIHGRALMSCFNDPRVILRHTFKAVKPGCYLEIQDNFFPLQFAGPTPTKSALYKWSEIVASGGAKSERPWTNLQHYKRWMEEIGFQDVVKMGFYTPTGPWAKGEYYKLIERYFNANLRFGFPAASWKVMGALG
ncbi:uncharacterized protein PAC_10677 [Phialocephala subalpina]|uniref:Uncharacterized protein n=1 Tax=Phialocephala subalpina TaxID=576137 RepID=A0A1L7X6Y9_9HELO|nr:uncharacterized protein PAC_10677 [Phialocephala subalpina]